MSCPTTVTNLYVGDGSRCRLRWTNQSTAEITRDVYYLVFRIENIGGTDYVLPLQEGLKTGERRAAGQTAETIIESSYPVPSGWTVDTTKVPSTRKYYHVFAAVGFYDAVTQKFTPESYIICQNVVYVPS